MKPGKTVATGFVRPSHRPEETTFTTLIAIQQRLPFGRPLTDAERHALAIAGSSPTALLHLDSTHSSRLDFMKAWRRFCKRIERHLGRPWVYVASVSQATGSQSGYHAHVLVWEYIPIKLIGQHARESGLQPQPQIAPLPRPTPGSPSEEMHGLEEAMDACSYVLGQHEGVFGSTPHARHDPLPKGSQRWLRPKDETLRNHRPELLDAFRKAQSKALSDFALGQSLPVFSRYKRRYNNGTTTGQVDTCQVDARKALIKLTGFNHLNVIVQAKTGSASRREVDGHEAVRHSSPQSGRSETPRSTYAQAYDGDHPP